MYNGQVVLVALVLVNLWKLLSAVVYFLGLLFIKDHVSNLPYEETSRDSGLLSGYMTHELPLEGNVNKPTRAGIHSEGGGQSSDPEIRVSIPGTVCVSDILAY